MTGEERAIFVKGPVVIFKWRNSPGWPVEYVSPNAAEVFGHSAQAFLAGEVGYADLIDPADAARVAQEVADASKSMATSFVHEPYRVRHSDGGTRWLYDFTNILRDGEGAATHYLGYVIDISARVLAEEQKRALERQLLHAQKLESLGVLAGGVAHDFNNLLTGILGQASLARRRMDSLAFVRERVIEIEVLALRASELTRQLLAYSGRGHFLVEPTDVSAAVHDMAAVLRVVLSKKAELSLELAPDLPSISADRTQLSQVIMNLLTNASDALGERQGKIRVSTRFVRLDSASLASEFGGEDLPSGSYVELEVSDTGEGMDEVTQTRLFDPFFTTKLTGRGLGMSAVLGIVRGHRGAIRVRSKKGHGSTFTLVFPASFERVEARPPTIESAWHGEGTVLVVDDEEPIVRATSLILRSFGLSVLSAKDGAEGLAVYRAHRDQIRLVLLDLTMPVVGGLEALSRLREEDAALPVILTSGYSDESAPITQSDPATTFLPKPYTAEGLAAALQLSLSRKTS